MPYFIRQIFHVTFLLLFTFTLINCGGGSGGTPPPPPADTTPPIIVSTTPSSEQVGVQTNVAIKVTFNENISDTDISNIAIYPFVNNSPQLNKPIILANNPFQFNNTTNTLTISLQQGEIKSATIYQVRINDVTDTIGNPMKSRCEWIFATEGTNAPVNIGVGNTKVCNAAPDTTIAPGLPQGVSAIAGNSIVTVSWQAPVTGGTPVYYKIDKSSDNQQTFSEVNANVPATSALTISDSNVQNGESYVYRIIAVNNIGESSATFSNIVTPVLPTPIVVPGAPQNITISAGDGTITLNWQAPIIGDAPTYYQIERSVTNAAFQIISTETRLSMTDFQAVNGKSHVYRITSVNSAGLGGAALSSAVTPQRIIGLPGTPQNVNAIAGDGFVDVNWSAPFSGEPPTYYKVEKSINGANFVDVNTNIPATTLTLKDSTAVNGSKHIYRVTAGTVTGLGTPVTTREVTPLKVYPFVEIVSQIPSTSNRFGESMAFSADGNMFVVGEPSGDPASAVDGGTVQIFTKSGNTWTNVQMLISPVPKQGWYFGGNVALSPDGKYLAVGEINSSQVYIYTRLNGQWVLSETLTQGAITSALFADAVAFSPSSTTLVIGAYATTVNGMSYAGSIELFTLTKTGWVYNKSLTAQSARNTDFFGSKIVFSSDGSTLAVGEETQSNPGSVHLFKKSGTSWIFGQEIVSNVAKVSNYFAYENYSIAFSPNSLTVAVGEPFGEPEGVMRGGTVQLFNKSGTIWNRGQVIVNRVNGVIPANEHFGASVAFNSTGNILVVSEFQKVHLLTKSASGWAVTGNISKTYRSRLLFNNVGNFLAVTVPSLDNVTNEKIRIYNLGP